MKAIITKFHGPVKYEIRYCREGEEPEHREEFDTIDEARAAIAAKIGAAYKPSNRFDGEELGFVEGWNESDEVGCGFWALERLEDGHGE